MAAPTTGTTPAQLLLAGQCRPVVPVRARPDGAPAGRHRGTDLGRRHRLLRTRFRASARCIAPPATPPEHGDAARTAPGLRRPVPRLPQSSRPRPGRRPPTGSGGRRAPAPAPDRRGVLDHPSGLAVDRRSQLYVAETGGDAVRVIDTVTQTLLARVSVEGHPVDVAPDCGRALVLTRGGLDGRTGRLLVLDGRRGARPGPDLVHPCYPNAAVPVRLTSAREGAAAGCPLVLWRSPDGRAAVARSDGTTLAELDGATDLDVGPDDRLVVAFGQGRPIRDFQVQGDRLLEREPLRAPGFDGASLALAPNGRVAFTTAAGYSWTAGSAARRAPAGGVVTYRLDALTYRTRWGRVFLDACLPTGTSLALRFVTTDSDDVLDPIAATPPERGARTILMPKATPPQAPEHLLAVARQETPTPPTVVRTVPRPPGRETHTWRPTRSRSMPPRVATSGSSCCCAALTGSRPRSVRSVSSVPATRCSPRSHGPGPGRRRTRRSCSAYSPRPRACSVNSTAAPRTGPPWSTPAAPRLRRWTGSAPSPGSPWTGAGRSRPDAPWSPRCTRCSGGAAPWPACCG